MSESYSAIVAATIEVAALFVLVMATSPVWMRAVNEITCRTIGRALTICPHCGVPAVVESTQPKVLR